jgi:O-methyltransferase domain/Dimerisation domain
MSELEPTRIMQIGSGYWASKVLLSAVGLGLYTELARQPMTAGGIARHFALVERPTTDFLDALVSLDLLARDGDRPDALYRNTPETARFLDKASPHYIGGILTLWENRNFAFWADLTPALRTGEAQSEVKRFGRPFFEALYEDPQRLEAFMDAMTGASVHNFELLAERFAFDRYRNLCDVGGADGLLAMTVAAAHPNLRCTIFDLPAVAQIATRKIAARGLADRVTAVAGDFFSDPLPRADVITMGMILHDWNLKRKKRLIAAAYDALPEGGAFIVIETLIDDARRENTFGLLMSLNMLIEVGDGFDYTAADFRAWCGEAGFRSFDVIPLAGPSSAGVAYK